MGAFLRMARLLVGASPRAMMRGAALALLVWLMGAALLGLSGWFITAAGIAGLAGLGIVFDVFRPSAGVRFLALGRTVARYGERLLTHDATLRAVAALRVTLLKTQIGRDIRAMEALRSETALTRIVSDVDALDGIILRLLLPVFAAIATHFIVFVVLGLLIGWAMAAAIALIYLPFAGLVLVVLARRAFQPSQFAEEQDQSVRRGMIDLLRDRENTILVGRLQDAEGHLLASEASARTATRRIDQLDRRAGALLSGITTVAVAAALLVGARLIESGQTDPALPAIGVFVALALAETIQPLRRGVAEFGRMQHAAQRVDALNSIEPRVRPEGEPAAGGGPLLQVLHDANDITLQQGEMVALTGRSGVGKTTLLLKVAALLPAGETEVLIDGVPPERWAEQEFRAKVGLLPQRSALMAGSVRENLALSGVQDDAAMLAALDAVLLGAEIADRGGLDLVLGEAGSGLSGGQARRLCLARLLLRQPDLLLLDEPLEGLDEAMSRQILENIRTHLPSAGILVCLHRHTHEHLFRRKYDLLR